MITPRLRLCAARVDDLPSRPATDARACWCSTGGLEQSTPRVYLRTPPDRLFRASTSAKIALKIVDPGRREDDERLLGLQPENLISITPAWLIEDPRLAHEWA
ncbi:MAG: hypothetical protein U5O16_23330 [Rhodococcus sp. (in: high G+C Gram-positive bacteria)]|nr:hypothetical protein [Rhodococcus sp. (in: high G+C Gram-positive bacteria)]